MDTVYVVEVIDESMGDCDNVIAESTPIWNLADAKALVAKTCSEYVHGLRHTPGVENVVVTTTASYEFPMTYMTVVEYEDEDWVGTFVFSATPKIVSS